MSSGAASWSSRARRCLAACAAGAALALLASLPATAQQHTSETDPRTECWRGFGYLLDGASGGYKSQEMLLVTIGTTVWGAGRPVELFLLDRASGLISEMPSFTIVPEVPPPFYPRRMNYESGKAPCRERGWTNV